MKDRIILTDADGVILDWEWAFNLWMEEHGFERKDGWQFKYEMSERFGISKDQAKKLIRMFNESAAIGFLPALRDAQHYVKRLHEEHGYIFHCITSLSKDRNAQRLRKMNIRKLFGETAFDEFIILGTGDDKDQALAPYKDTGCWWIEDKPENALVGSNLGLNSLVMEHGHNMHDDSCPRVRNWKEVYEIITQS